MRISVKVKPRSKKAIIQETALGCFKIWVKEAPDNGKANEAVIEVLSQFFKKPKACFEIVRGLSSREKIIEIK